MLVWNSTTILIKRLENKDNVMGEPISQDFIQQVLEIKQKSLNVKVTPLDETAKSLEITSNSKIDNQAIKDIISNVEAAKTMSAIEYAIAKRAKLEIKLDTFSLESGEKPEDFIITAHGIIESKNSKQAPKKYADELQKITTNPAELEKFIGEVKMQKALLELKNNPNSEIHESLNTPSHGLTSLAQAKTTSNFIG